MMDRFDKHATALSSQQGSARKRASIPGLFSQAVSRHLSFAPSKICIAVACAVLPVSGHTQAISLQTFPGGVVTPLLNSAVSGISSDGGAVVGSAHSNAAGNPNRAYRWTAATGMISLGVLNGGNSAYANGVSADGNVVVGFSADGSAANLFRAFRWTQAGGMISLGTFNGGRESLATAVSSDGNVIAGGAENGYGSGIMQAFRWTQANGIVSLGSLNGGPNSLSYAISANGNVIVGSADDGAVGGANRAFRWTQATGIKSLGTLNGAAHSAARGVSADGNVVVGYVYGGAPGAQSMAFRWTSGTGMQGLGTLAGSTDSYAYGISGDGQVIVGNATVGASSIADRGFRWTQATGMQSVKQWLAAGGVSTAATFEPRSATATNADGSVVSGILTDGNPYLARVSPQGSGAIDIPAYIQTLPILPQVQQIADADLILHGLHGSPMRHLLQAGGQGAWVAGDVGRFSKGDNQGGVGAGEVGFAYGLSDDVMLKLAIGRTYSRQDLVDSGRIGNQGSFIVPEVIVRLPAAPDVRLSASGYYNWGSADIRRNYLNAGTMVGASGSPTTRTAALRLRADWIDALAWQGVSLSPYASLTLYRGRVAAYTEAGGGFPVAWNSRAERATQARLGADAAWRASDDLTLTARLEGVRRLNREGGGASGTLIGPGGFAFDLPGQTYKQNWLRAGIGLEAQAGPGVASAMLNVSTRDDGPKCWAYAGYRINW